MKQRLDPASFFAGIRALRRVGDAPDTRSARFFTLVGEDMPLKARNRLVFPSLMTDAATLAQHDLADWQYTPAPLRRFAALVVEGLRKGEMPFFVAHAASDRVQLAHCKFGAMLQVDEWQLVHAVGFRVAAKEGMSIAVGQSGCFVDLLALPLPLPVGQGPPVRLTPRGILSREMRGG